MELLQKIAQRHNTSTAQISLAWLLAQKPFIVPIPGTRQLAHMKENTASVNVRLTAEDLKDLAEGFAKIEIVGDRAPQSTKAAHDIGTALGASSRGTHGGTPLPKKK